MRLNSVSGILPLAHTRRDLLTSHFELANLWKREQLPIYYRHRFGRGETLDEVYKRIKKMKDSVSQYLLGCATHFTFVGSRGDSFGSVLGLCNELRWLADG